MSGMRGWSSRPSSTDNSYGIPPLAISFPCTIRLAFPLSIAFDIHLVFPLQITLTLERSGSGSKTR